MKARITMKTMHFYLFFYLTCCIIITIIMHMSLMYKESQTIDYYQSYVLEILKLLREI